MVRNIIVALALFAGLGLSATSAKADWITDIFQSLVQTDCSDCSAFQDYTIVQQ